MKTLRENNTKTTKDVLLHQILQEISDENKEMNDDPYLDEIIPIPNTRLWKIQKKWQWLLVSVLMISIIYMLFNIDTKSTQSEKQITHNHIYTMPKANQIRKQKVETEPLGSLREEAKNKNSIKRTTAIQTIEKVRIEKNSVKEKEIEVQTATSPKEPKTAREKAKEALFMQMQN